MKPLRDWSLLILWCLLLVPTIHSSPCRGTSDEIGSWRRNPSVSAEELLRDPLDDSWWDCPYFDFLRPEEHTGTVTGTTRPRKDYKRSHCVYDDVDPQVLTYRHDYFEPECDMTQVNFETVVKYLFYNRTTVLMGDSLSKQHQKDLHCMLWGFTVPDRETGVPIRAFKSSFDGTRHRMHVDLRQAVFRNKPADHPAFHNPTIYLECEIFHHTRSELPEDDIGFARICFFPSGYPSHVQHETTWSTQWKDMSVWLKPRDLLVMNYGLHVHMGASSMKNQLGPAAEIWRSPQFHNMRHKKYPLMIWRETTPQHFSTGAYSSQEAQAEARKNDEAPDVTPDMCVDHLDGKDNPHAEWSRELEEDLGFPVLHIYSKVVHRSKEKCGLQSDTLWDCTHYCEPHSGPVALMTRLLFDKLAIIERDVNHPSQHKASAESSYKGSQNVQV